MSEINTDYLVYVSGWTEKGGDPGLALYDLDSATGQLKFIRQLEDKTSFNASVYDPGSNTLFVNNEVTKLPGTNLSGGRVYAYQIDLQTGDITERFHIDTHTPNPCYVSIADDGKYLIIAHCSGGGTVSVFNKNETGQWEPDYITDDPTVQLYVRTETGDYRLADVKKHLFTEPVIVNGRLKSCHPHSAVISPSGNLVAVCDKGDFNIYMYRLDRANDELTFCGKWPTGGQARYCLFHPTKPFLYVNQEGAVDADGMENTPEGDLRVHVFLYDEAGQLDPISSVSVKNFEIPAGKHCEQQGFLIHPTGEFLYTQINATKNEMAVLKIDQITGELSILGYAPIEGIRPRGCAMTPDGKWIISSSMVSGDISVFAIGDDGMLIQVCLASHKQPGASYITIIEK